MTLTLEEWDHKIGHHLHMIEDGAKQCEQHVNCLVFKPSFETSAEADLVMVEHTLSVALTRVRSALRGYRSKDIGD